MKIHRKGQMTLPVKLRSLAGISEGDLVEAAFPTADAEFTPAERRGIEARLAKSDADIKHGSVYGPFVTAEDMAASIEANIKKLRSVKRKSKPAA